MPLRASQRPIGVFDSGLGGLTVVREIRRRLPGESIVYLGDLAHLPYGIKSKQQIIRYSLASIRFLLKHRVKAVVVACNSSSSTALAAVRRAFRVPVLDVLKPAVEAALQTSASRRIGLIATAATVESRAYERELKRRRPGIRVWSQACPLLVPIVESGWRERVTTERIIRSYLKPLCGKKIDTLILGCTHYPLLKSVLQKILGPGVTLVDSAHPTVAELEKLLERKKLRTRTKRRGSLKVFVTDRPRNFKKIGERFLGETLARVSPVQIQES